MALRLCLEHLSLLEGVSDSLEAREELCGEVVLQLTLHDLQLERFDLGFLLQLKMQLRHYLLALQVQIMLELTSKVCEDWVRKVWFLEHCSYNYTNSEIFYNSNNWRKI